MQPHQSSSPWHKQTDLALWVICAVITLLGLCLHAHWLSAASAYMEEAIPMPLLPYAIAAFLSFALWRMPFQWLERMGIGLFFAILLVCTALSFIWVNRSGTELLHFGDYVITLSHLPLILPFSFLLMLTRLGLHSWLQKAIAGLSFLWLIWFSRELGSTAGLALLLLVCAFSYAIAWDDKTAHKPWIVSICILTGILTHLLFPHLFGHMCSLFIPHPLIYYFVYPYGFLDFDSQFLYDCIRETQWLTSTPLPMEHQHALPEPLFIARYPLTYFLFAFGRIFFVLFCMLILGLTWYGIHLSMQLKHPLRRLLSVSICLTFSLQAAFYCLYSIGGNLSSHLHFPFFTNYIEMLFLDAILLGCLLSLHRSNRLEQANEDAIC